MDAIADALVVAQPHGDDTRIVMLVMLNNGYTFDEELAHEIRTKLRDNASPRHVPGVIVAVSALPYTRSGKKMEMAVAKRLRGLPVEDTKADRQSGSTGRHRGDSGTRVSRSQVTSNRPNGLLQVDL